MSKSAHSNSRTNLRDSISTSVEEASAAICFIRELVRVCQRSISWRSRRVSLCAASWAASRERVCESRSSSCVREPCNSVSSSPTRVRSRASEARSWSFTSRRRLWLSIRATSSACSDQRCIRVRICTSCSARKKTLIFVHYSYYQLLKTKAKLLSSQALIIKTQQQYSIRKTF